MKRLTTALVVVTVLVPVGAAQAFSPARRAVSCRYYSSPGPVAGWSDWKVRATLACAVTKFDVPGGYGTMVAIGERESHLHANAYNGSSGACGLFQHLSRYWGGRVADYNAHVGPRLGVRTNCLNARSNALVSAWMMAVAGLGPWS